VPMCFLRAKPIGVMQMLDQGEQDDKVGARVCVGGCCWRTGGRRQGGWEQQNGRVDHRGDAAGPPRLLHARRQR
jgi:hypothetical protein